MGNVKHRPVEKIQADLFVNWRQRQALEKEHREAQLAQLSLIFKPGAVVKKVGADIVGTRRQPAAPKWLVTEIFPVGDTATARGRKFRKDGTPGTVERNIGYVDKLEVIEERYDGPLNYPEDIALAAAMLEHKTAEANR